MGIRSIGTVTLSFGLISIHAKIYSAIESGKEISFNLIEKATGSRVKQQYVRTTDMKTVVDKEDMVKGYEYSTDKYLIFSKEEMKALDEIGTKAIEITEFVPFNSINPLYLDSTYYLVPDKAAAKPYDLFVKALAKSGRAGIGTWANRGRGHVVAIRSIDGHLAMQQLHFDSDVRKVQDYEVPTPAVAVKPAELKLASQLIDQLAVAAYDPATFKDEHQARLQAAIVAKLNGTAIPVTAEEAPAKDVDLMAALEASLAVKAPRRKKVKAA